MNSRLRRPLWATVAKQPVQSAFASGQLAQPANGLTVVTAQRVACLERSSGTSPDFLSRKFFAIGPHGPVRLGTSVAEIPDQAHAIAR